MGHSACMTKDHVSMHRLFAIAAAHDGMFDLGEFSHIKVCAECFKTWSKFIHQLILMAASSSTAEPDRSPQEHAASMSASMPL
jgi:hypothetical protein